MSFMRIKYEDKSLYSVGEIRAEVEAVTDPSTGEARDALVVTGSGADLRNLPDLPLVMGTLKDAIPKAVAAAMPAQ